jgi:hypothetical protein
MKGERWKMISLLHLIISLIFAGIAIWILVIIGRYYYYLFNPPHEIVFVAFEAAGGQKNQDAPQSLSAKLRQLQLYAVQSPSGYGFLQMPMLATLPKEADKSAKDSLAELSKISLKVKEVDVNQLIKSVRELFSPPQYELSGRVVDLTNAVEISCEMTLEGRPIRSWQSRSRYGAANQPASAEKLPDKAGATDKGLDDILFQMIYDFLTKEEFKDWGISMKGERPPVNWQTLQAYVRGVQALGAYQQTLDYTDLKESLSHLERVPVLAPDNAEGIYYYALALSEDRQEAEAVASFEQVQRLLGAHKEADDLVPASQKMSEKAKLNAKKMSLEARLNRETARLKLYKLNDGLKAKEELDKLIEELKTEVTNAPATNPDHWYYKKLLAISYAQLAYTHGTILVLPGEEKLLGPADSPDNRNRIILKNIEDADAEYNIIAQGKKWDSDREGKGVLFRIRNAEGYSKFRYAQSRYKLRQIDRGAFIQECNDAIGILEQANHARPNHYEVLQNMAMIYEDEDFESMGRYLDTAEALYERTKRFVPNDYYQYEHLAVIQWRRVMSAGLTPSAKPLIQKGKDYAAKAVELRPETGTAPFLLARFNARSWDIDKAAQSATDASSYFKQALNARPNRVDILDEYRAFSKKLSDGQANGLTVTFDYGVFLLELAKRDDVKDKATLLNEVKDLMNKVKTEADKDAAKKELSNKATAALDEAVKLQAAL